MRTTIRIHKDWAFAKVEELPTHFPHEWARVELPHTWNSSDGQDGGNDYYRGKCCYARKLSKAELARADRYFLELRGANASAEVYLNGKRLGRHDGGYSTWRVELTDALCAENLLVVMVDNSPNETVYPQSADFTFYGGLYREVNILCVSRSHFSLTYYGGPGIKVTSTLSGSDAQVEVQVYLTDAQQDDLLHYILRDAQGNPVCEQTVADTAVTLQIPNVHRWHGRRDPYLYTAEVQLLQRGQVVDAVSTRFGCRTFAVDPDKGFLLNEQPYPLRGVSRHQDRQSIGNALLPQHHLQDMDLICELGATTVRLAHYQQDSYFYDLCDERGLIVWAEIPYISKHMPRGRANTLSQMKELIVQNYNHPSIVFWGLSNEITMGGEDDPDLIENHRLLNDMVHEMDKTRLTTLAALTTCRTDSAYIHIPDTVAYNHYFGWYGGDVSMYGAWFDRFHAQYPHTPIGCSEYGCEALDWHTSKPIQGDYTEEYQAHYHEELIKQLFTRSYLWATYVWNMFDFGADARNEGGENGINHKGLVTFDRKYKKDAFYAYKAWLSEEAFVHICGKRYVDRVEAVTRVTVYSNQPQVELFANGESVGVVAAADHFFYFDVPNCGETVLKAVAGKQTDESRIRKVERFNEKYRLREKGAVLNWFDIVECEGYLSIHDTVAQIRATEGGAQLFERLLKRMKAGKNGQGGLSGMVLTDEMLRMLDGFTLLRLTGMLGTFGVTFTKDELLDLHHQLSQIKKPQ